MFQILNIQLGPVFIITEHQLSSYILQWEKLVLVEVQYM